MDRSRYPDDWGEISLAIRERADWTCENCGLQCRRPGEPFDTHKRTLTVSHIDHDPANCDPGNLVALCAPCHLRYDARHHAANAFRTRMQRAQAAGQTMLEV
jgi:5-methylcytosine-specific restriction endonuclease McrA